MKRFLMVLTLALLVASPAFAGQKTLKSLRVDLGSCASPPNCPANELRWTSNVNTYATILWISPSFNTDGGVMWIGESGTKEGHGIRITHIQAVHTGAIKIKAEDIGGSASAFDLYNLRAVCNQPWCGLSVTYPADE
jgi:hypothetical protein